MSTTNIISRWRVSRYTIRRVYSAKACVAHTPARNITKSKMIEVRWVENQVFPSAASSYKIDGRIVPVSR